MKKLAFLILLASITSLTTNAQIKSGPMLGYNTMKEVLVWVQMESATEVSMTYWEENQKSDSRKVKVSALESQAFTAKLIAKDLEPGTTYQYSISENGKQLAEGEFTTLSLWQHREDPPEWNMLTGSCAYTNETKYDRPGEPYGKSMDIFKTMSKQEAEMMLWLGDNIYLREVDWSSQSGINHRYTHFKSQSALKELWKNMHHYAIWDDHDFGPNDADRSFVGKEMTLEAFQNFWGNYEYGINDKPGITTQFSYHDVDFFLLDNRYYRSPNDRNTGPREILGEEQIQWLIDALVNSKATFKIVAIGGQLLNTAAVWENHATYPEERQKVIDLIQAEEIKNVVFLSGDRHKTELSELKLDSNLTIYEYTCSPLSSTAYNSIDEGNELQVEGTHVATQNFGMLSFSGTFKERKLTIKTFDASGKLLWEREILKK